MLQRLFLLVMLCFFTKAHADDANLIRIAEPWRYFKGTNEPSNPAQAWRDLQFPDADWPSAPSGFSSSSTPIGEASSFNDYTNKFSTLYLRKKFTVADPSSIKWLILRVDYDDGFVAYLNGTEVVRRGLPGNPGDFVPFDALATRHPRGALEEIDLMQYVNLLVAGDNVLAVQVHNSGLESALCFVPELLGNFIRGPFLINVSATSAQIGWKTLLPTDATVDYGADLAAPLSISIPDLSTNHLVTLPNLTPGTAYQYRVRSKAGQIEAVGPARTFTTMKASGPITFSVMGDTGLGGAAQYAVANALRAANPEFVTVVGDLIYPSMVPFLLDSRVFSVYGQQMANTPFFFAYGNHDSYSSKTIMTDNFYLPTRDPTGAQHYYSFDAGEAHFAILFTDLQAGAAYYPGSPQYAWLEQDLAQTTKPWKFLFFHHVIRSSSFHSGDDYDLNGVGDMAQLEQSIGVLAAKYGVQLIFNGHDHDYERLAPVAGTASFVTGGGGSFPYTFVRLHPASVQYQTRFHFLKVHVETDETVVQAIDLNGTLFDQIHIRRDFTPRQTYQADWNSPAIPSRPADDGDGNVTGQTFTFKGAPIPCKPGQFSNSGRLWVSNDKNNLYLGLDEMEAPGGKNVFLFIENPNQPGVHSMGPIGNGKVDPDGEGADGLDFLSNLAFTNFAPTIGCILGDEFGDSLYRSFTRTGMPINTGQGAFYLAPGLPEVPGLHLQQFNRSPQASGVPYEQNADYAEMSIPLAALGNLKPGQTVRVGVVVGLESVDSSPLAQTRQLDSGGVGYSIAQVSGITFLEPVEIQLAPDQDPDNDGLTDAQEVALGTDARNPDSDGDGLPDGWEVAYKLNPLSTAGKDGADGDLDGDGLTNMQELLAGSDPTKADSDGDGLPDAWEIRYGLNPGSPVGVDGPNADLDNDGQTNLQEYLRGTDPSVPDQPFVLAVRLENGQQLRVTWPSALGKRYQLQSTSELGSGFQDVTDSSFPAAGTGSPLSFEQTVPPGSLGRFYRVKIVP